MRSEPTTNPHAGSEELARFLDRRLDPRARARLAEHLAECAACRADLICAGRVLRMSGAGSRLVGVVTLAVVVVVAVVGVAVVRPGNNSRIRGPGSPPPLVAYSPIGQVDQTRLRFTWGAASAGTLYRLSLFDSSGATLWTVSIRDTTAALPTNRTLARGTAYTWIVDALQSDGSERGTGVRQFQIGQ